MNFALSEQMIKELCGIAAYKKGKAYFEANKVVLHADSKEEATIKATVKAGEDFTVLIRQGEHNQLVAECSCPPVGFIKTHCQHIAAVLLAARDVQAVSSPLADQMLSLFSNPSGRPAGKQLHFDTRQTVAVEFTCFPFLLENAEYGIGLRLQAGISERHRVLRVLEFLKKVERKEPAEITSDFTYNPEWHNFNRETDAVLQFLIKSSRIPSLLTDREGMILVSVSDWLQLLPLLQQAPHVSTQQGDQLYKGLRLAERLPVRFEIEERPSGSYVLEAKGLSGILVLSAYGYAFTGGELVPLPEESCRQLVELKNLLEFAGEPRLTIPASQMEHFMKTAIPGLMKLGNVKMDDGVARSLGEVPLRAKLYLDRVSNRLLAGLEFHYGQLIINPCEEEEAGLEHYPGLRRHIVEEQRIMQMMHDSLFNQTDGGFYIHNEEAEYDFLYHWIPKFEEVVEVYATTSVKMRLHTGYIGPKIKMDFGERTDWLEFRFDLQGIPEKEIQKLLKALEHKRKYYRIPNGQLLSLETPDFLAFNDFMNEVELTAQQLDEQEFRIPLLQAMKMLDVVEGGEVIEPGENFARLLKNLNHPLDHAAAVPERLESIMRDYQKAGYRWLKLLAKYQFGGILADDMGLGKTLQSIAYIVSVLPEIRAHKRPVLVVSPASLTYNWLNEMKKFAPELNVRIIDGTKAKRKAIFESSVDTDIFITSYPSLRSDAAFYSGKIFHSLFLDEAQAFKNPITKTARSLKLIEADYKFALTGTPIENSIDELWSIFHVVFPELLPGRRAFSELRREEIAKRVRPFILRRLKKEVLTELPEKIETMQYSDLQKEQKKIYAAYLAELKHDALKHLAKGSLKKNKIRILAGLTRLRQICCHPALFVEGYTGSSAKFEQLFEIIEESRLSGRRVLIFSQFTQMLGLIGRQLARQGQPYFYLDGQTPAAERVALCDRFNEGEGNLFLISLKAGGTGLNLTGADTVILYDLWWNPAVEQQATDRAHRMGQQNTVQVIRMAAKGTIEEKINELQEKKKNLIDEVIQPGSEALTAMTEEDIREILMIE